MVDKVNVKTTYMKYILNVLSTLRAVPRYLNISKCSMLKTVKPVPPDTVCLFVCFFVVVFFFVFFCRLGFSALLPDLLAAQIIPYQISFRLYKFFQMGRFFFRLLRETGYL